MAKFVCIHKKFNGEKYKSSASFKLIVREKCRKITKHNSLTRKWYVHIMRRDKRIRKVIVLHKDNRKFTLKFCFVLFVFSLKHVNHNKPNNKNNFFMSRYRERIRKEDLSDGEYAKVR